LRYALTDTDKCDDSCGRPVDMNHDYGSVNNITTIFTVAQKGITLWTYEKFYIYKYRKIKQILNKQNAIG
jgi:hypothetical protein